jgi:Gas vesicle synthesis protein GvpL/GvpF
MGSAYYTYAVARPFDPHALGSLRGVDDSAVRLMRHRDLVAVASPLAWDAASEDAVRKRLESPAALEAMVRTHHAVVDAVARHAVTIPLRLATIHHDGDRVLDLLHRGHASLAAMLDRFTGRVEMGVKIYLDAVASSAVAEPETPTPSGRGYLLARRDQRDRRERLATHAVSVVECIEADLARLAVDRRVHQPQGAALGNGHGDNIVNVAYLVDTARVAELLDSARLLGAEADGVRIVVTGPWAPYSFAQAEDIGEPR